MQEKNYEMGEDIITYGDDGRDYFILDLGTVEIIVYKPGTDPKRPDIDTQIAFTKVINKAFSFGEIALMYNDKRTATVKAATKCKVWALEGNIFKNIVIK